MTLSGLFVGIDRHQSPDIRELSGARRDATALWALFADSLPAANLQLLVNEGASVDAIRRDIRALLGEAGPDDAVILTFSGHGSQDHRIVAYDTELASLGTTTLGMDELAELFRSSRAGAILCVLDCCFSGAAPARVLERTPLTRDPGTPLATLAGNGRILLSAAGPNQSALEHPTKRHGLLTLALLDALQSGTDTHDLLGLVSEMQATVRAQALGLGYTQEPAVLGHLATGLVLPVLHRGQNYLAAFPEARPRLIDTMLDLNAQLPEGVVAEWAARYPGGLNPLQLAALNDHQVLEGTSLLVVAPTSSGKTFVGELAAAKAIADGRKAVFLLPYKALANEKFDQFTDLYGGTLGMRVIRCTGDYGDSAAAFTAGRFDLALLTYEMFLGLLLTRPELLFSVGLVVVDEAHFISDPHRGITVELILAYLKSARLRGLEPQIVALSAAIGDVNYFHDWLEIELLHHTDRPVPLVEGVLDRNGVYEFLDPDGNRQTTQLLAPGTVYQRKREPSSQDVIVPLVRQLVNDSPAERVIIFRNQRGSAQGAAGYLADELGLAAADAVIVELPEQDLSAVSHDLRHCLRGGTAFHTSNLSKEERAAVERGFRDAGAGIHVLAATTTVAAGINTPASTVIIAEHEFKGAQTQPYTVAEYKNMAGRAGRMGFAEQGRSILLADNSTARIRLFQVYVAGEPEALSSSFKDADLNTWVIKLLSQVNGVHRDDVPGLLAATYGGFLRNRRDPTWSARTQAQIAGLLTRMTAQRLVEEEDGLIRLSLLGRVCAEAPLSLESALRLVELIRRSGAQARDPNFLMGLIQVVPELDSQWIPLARKGTAEARWTSGLTTALAQALQFGAADLPNYWARCKKSAVLRAWTRGTPLNDIETGFSVNPFNRLASGDITGLADSTRFHLRAAHRIATVVVADEPIGVPSLDDVLLQLEFGLPAEALPLLQLPMPLLRGECLRLSMAGLNNADEVFRAPADQIAKSIGEQRAKALLRFKPSAPAK